MSAAVDEKPCRPDSCHCDDSACTWCGGKPCDDTVDCDTCRTCEHCGQRECDDPDCGTYCGACGGSGGGMDVMHCRYCRGTGHVPRFDDRRISLGDLIR